MVFYTLSQIGNMFGMSATHLNYYMDRFPELNPALVGKRKVYGEGEVKVMATWLAQHFSSDNPRKSLVETVLSAMANRPQSDAFPTQ